MQSAYDALTSALDAEAEPVFSPTQYLEQLLPLLRTYGITRLADITGLDCVGLPVVQAVRPEAKSNAVTQGKGLTLEAAAIGATLECIEMAAGEDLGSLPPSRPPDDPQIWRPFACGAEWPTQTTEYVSAVDLSNGHLQSVPRDLLSTDFSKGAAAEAAPILRHSIGLGAGPSFVWALRHGLQESIEADARIKNRLIGQLERQPDNPTYGRQLALAERAGLRVRLRQLAGSADGFASVEASVMERPGASALPLPALGFAARSSMDAAIGAALSEALQARLAAISGAREDITRRFYDVSIAPEDLEAVWAQHAPDTGRAVRAGSKKTGSPRQIAKLLGRVLAVPLTWKPEVPLAVARVICLDLIADPEMLP